MSIATLAVIFWGITAVAQIGLSMHFLELVKQENEAEYDRIKGDGMRGWLLINPLVVGSAYTDPVLHEMWGLSETAMRFGRRLRFVTMLSYFALAVCGVLLVHEMLSL
jgi:hypothetical protein